MTSDEMKPMDDGQMDAQFDAFLQGRDGLAQLLRQMPQPTPSPALDAAILAAASAAVTSVAVTPATITPPANDPVLPGARRPQHVSWITRWRVPMGLAASLVLVLQVVWKQQAMIPADTESAAIHEAKPVAAPPKDLPVEVAAQASAIVPQQKPMAVSPVRQDDAREAMSRQMADKMASQQMASQQMAQLAKQSKAKMQMASKDDARNSMADAKMEAKKEALAEPQPIIILRSAQPAPIATQATPLSAPAPAPAPNLPAAAMEVDASPQSAKEWIVLIEGKLKAGLPDEALAEWVKFRKLHPSYPVSDSLLEQIKALKK